jgi:CrcB protein
MIKVLLVGAGGALGSVARYLMTGWIHRLMNEHWFPFGTLACNILGCFLIGLLAGIVDLKDISNEHIRLFFVVGILGGFTTFSAFSNESVHLFSNDQGMGALLYVIFSVTACLGAAWAGYNLVRLG